VNRVAVVTGGASGIGLAVVERLLGDGWTLGVIDANRAALAQAEAEFEGEDALFLACDITDEDEVAEVFDRVADTLGPLAALVNSAGIARHAPALQTSLADFDLTTGINLRGAYFLPAGEGRYFIGFGRRNAVNPTVALDEAGAPYELDLAALRGRISTQHPDWVR